jgi:cytochrome c oxidase assembly protein subunit 11
VTELERRNRRMGIIAASVVAVMCGLCVASVPLYNLYCATTGFAGTTSRAEEGEALPTPIDRELTIRFDSAVDSALPWDFGPDQRSVRVRIGEPALVSYHAASRADVTTSGTAVYNVSPPEAGRYFRKIQCFCFDRQSLGPGQSAHMPVYFYVDPAIAENRGLDGMTAITLSYTFFRADDAALDPNTSGGYQAAKPAQGG